MCVGGGGGGAAYAEGWGIKHAPMQQACECLKICVAVCNVCCSSENVTIDRS